MGQPSTYDRADFCTILGTEKKKFDQRPKYVEQIRVFSFSEPGVSNSVRWSDEVLEDKI
jgi:hypothetical protein